MKGHLLGEGLVLLCKGQLQTWRKSTFIKKVSATKKKKEKKGERKKNHNNELRSSFRSSLR